LELIGFCSLFPDGPRIEVRSFRVQKTIGHQLTESELDMLRSSPLLQLYLVRLRDFYRQPARVFWVYGFPTLLALVLGFAFRNRPPEPVLVDLVQSPRASAIAQALAAHNRALQERSQQGKAPSIRPPITVHEADASTALKRLNTGKTPLVIEPSGSESWIYRYDPTRPEATTARQLVDDVLQEAFGRTNSRPTTDAFVTEPGSRYIDFLIPGLIGLNSMGGGLWGIGFLLVTFRIRKLLKRFVATPMRRSDFLLAVLGARLTFVLPDLAVLLLLGTAFFQMPIRGNLALVVAIDLVGSLAFAGIGLLVACRASTTEAVSGLMNVVMLPMWLFSGVFFSTERFPSAAQPFIQALPLTQLVSALRRVILEGAGVLEVSGPMIILAAWAIVSFSLALRFFRWT
jgi:ABC-type multidrug transport system permease subunit